MRTSYIDIGSICITPFDLVSIILVRRGTSGKTMYVWQDGEDSVANNDKVDGNGSANRQS